jgi:hypothetical protein
MDDVGDDLWCTFDWVQIQRAPAIAQTPQPRKHQLP